MIAKNILFSLLLALVAGCASLGGSGGVDAIHLFGLPVTLNLDGAPGTDGFAVRVYATQNGEAKGSPIRDGSVEIWMFDGVIDVERILSTPPTQSWKFSVRELNRFAEKTSLGNGYRFALRWNQSPKHGHITVVARYLAPKGAPIYSSPSTINAAPK